MRLHRILPLVAMLICCLVPVAFAVTVPAEALTNRLTPSTMIGALALTFFFVVLSRFIWRLGVRNYSGASA